MSPEIARCGVLKEVVQDDLRTYTHSKCESRLGFCVELGLTSSYSRPLLLNNVLVATKYPKQQGNDLAYKVTPTRPMSVLNDSRAASSRTIMPGFPVSVSY
jgi:hypothetical protein